MKKLNNSKILTSSSFLTALEKNKREDRILKDTYDILEKKCNSELNNVNKKIFLNQNFSYELKFQKYLCSINHVTTDRNRKSIDYSSFFQNEFPNYFELINGKLRRSKNFYAPFLTECVRREEINSSRKISDLLEYDAKNLKPSANADAKESNKTSFKDSRSSSLASSSISTSSLTRSASASYSMSKKNLPNIEQAKKKRVKSAFQLGEDDLLSKSIRRERTSASIQNEKYREKLKVARLAKQFILYNKFYCSRRCDLRNQD